VPGSAFIGPPNGPTYAFFLVQAPDILKPGPGGSYPNYTQPVQWNYQCDGGAMNSVLIALAPPPVLLVHGLWGSSTSLAITQEYLYGIAPYSGLSADFIYPVAYENDAAFDSSEVAGDVQLDINMATTRLMNDGLMFGRWDVIAHSMGGPSRLLKNPLARRERIGFHRSLD
jgi:pimeloyl-ACP methyl ester carboxylesterase